eukprot:gene18143-23797_t
MVKSIYPNNKNIRIVLGMSSDKDLSNCISLLLQLISSIESIYCVQARHPRATSRSELTKLINKISTDSKLFSKAKTCEDIDTNNNIKLTIRKAINDSLSSNDRNEKPVILICGTAFIMAEARSELGIVEPKDSDYLDINNPDSQEYFGDKI